MSANRSTALQSRRHTGNFETLGMPLRSLKVLEILELASA